MKLVNEHDPILKQKCDPFNFEDPIMDPYELSDELQKIRKEGAGIGLAAPQVGLNTQVLINHSYLFIECNLFVVVT